jgi:hypothetical protein
MTATTALTTEMRDIERKALAYSTGRAKLAEIVGTLQEGIEALKRDYLPTLRYQIRRLAEQEADLKALLEENPDLFVKPKTVVLHGVRVGFEKGKGAVLIEDEDQVVKLIKKRLPELAEQLIKTVETPLKAGLAQLSVAQLKSIGCQVEETGDRVVIRAVDRDVDKLVTALLKGATDAS